MGEYSKAAILKYSRKSCGMTQEKLAENICDPVTLARYESGMLEPTDDKFEQLMQKMGRAGERYVLMIHDETIEHRMKNILYAFERKEFDVAKEELEILKADEKFDDTTPENRQYVQRIELNIAYRKGEIDSEKMLTGLIEALKITFPEYNEEHFHVYRIFTETEVLLINNIAAQYWDKGEQQLAIHLHENMEEYYQLGVAINDYKPRYICLLNYSNHLGLSGYYDKSIEICERGIQWLNLNGKVNYLYNFYYNIGWNLMKKIEQRSLPDSMRNIAQYYIWQAMQLCDIFPESKQSWEKIRNYYLSIKDE